MDVHSPCVTGKVVAPDQVEQLAPLEDAAGVARQEREQVELLGPELNLRLTVPNLVTLEVDLELAGANELRRIRLDACAPQQRFGPSDELLGMEWLGQVVVRADLEPDDLVGDLVPGGQHDDRHLAQLADLLAYGQAVGAGKHDVEHHEIRLELPEPG